MSHSHSHSQYVKRPNGDDSPTEPSSYSQRTLPDTHHNVVTMQVPTADMKKDSPPPPPVPTKKRESWTEKEHRLFLVGLTKYGKGEWTRISTNVIPSRTSSQIASHAQKYFLRQTSCPLNATRKKRRSIHDITINESDHAMLPQLMDNYVAVPQELHQAQQTVSHPNPPTAEQESELMDYMNSLPPLPNCEFINDDIESLQQARGTTLHLNPTQPNSLRQQMDIRVRI